MIFKYDVCKIGEKTYISGSRLISERGSPEGEYEFSKPIRDLLSDTDKALQWTIRDNSDYDPEVDRIEDRYIIERDPIQPTTEELEAKKQAAIKQQLTAELPDIILQNKDKPGVLAQALCDRAKEIEVKHETKRDTEAIDSKVP